MTTPFLETPRFPDHLAFYALGGVSYNTVVAGSTSGRETRNSIWQYGRAQFDLQGAMRSANGVANANSIQVIRNFFRVCKGQAYGFRFRDWTDYQDEGSGVIGPLLPNYGSLVTPTGAPTGGPTAQMYKTYVMSPLADYKPIQKPLTATFFRNGVQMSTGSSPGNYSLDTTTGIVSFVADSSAGVTGWTPGSSTSFTVSAVPSGWAVGKKLYFSSVSGDTNSVINGQAVSITAISGTTVTVSANTTGETLSGGVAYMYPQPTETITWTGTFDLAVRFATDVFAPQIEPDGTLYAFQTLTIAEIRL
jgi:uncharacterized protein (TIGR02217 family)